MKHGPSVSASLVVTIAPADGGSVDRLLQNAELAAIESKRSGGSATRFYNPSFKELTDAHVADYLLCVTKTKAGRNKQEGITLFLVDARIRV